MSTKKEKESKSTITNDAKGIRNPDLYPNDSRNFELKQGIASRPLYIEPPKTKNAGVVNSLTDSEQQSNGYDLLDYAKLFRVSAQDPTGTYLPSTIRQAGVFEPTYSGLPQGQSRYDAGIMMNPTMSDIQDTRASEQSEWLKLLNGITKGVITAGTTFVNNMAGLPVALARGFINLGDKDATTTFLSGFWDNPLTQATMAVNEWMEKAIPNYYDSQGRNTVGNLIGDKFLKNMGFMLGTVASAYTGNALGVGAGALISRGGAAMAGKLASRIVNDSLKAAKASTFTRGFITSAYNSFAEAAIEASNNSKEWYDSQKYNLYTDLMAGNIDENQYNERLQQLKLDKTKMGNADFLGNVALLTLSNSIQFGRAFGTGFETGQSFLRVMQENNLYKIAQGKPETVLKGLRGAVAEGLEEVNQKAISAMSGLAAEEDYLAYFKNRNDYKSQKFVNRVINNFNQGIKDTYTDPASLEEFAIGALIGVTGVPFMKRVSVTNPDGTTTMKNKFGMVGGLFDELSEYKATVAEQQPYIDEVNNHMVERQERMRNLMTHAASQKEQGAFLMDKNKFNYKNSEFKELFADVDLYSKLGILDDLKQMWSQLEVDNNTINDIIQAGTSDEGPKQKSIGTDDNGNPVDREEIKSRIEKTKQNVLDTIEQYRKTRFDVMTDSRGLLSDEQLSQLTWMKMMGKNWETRLNEMLSENDNELKSVVQDAINSVIEREDVKNNKTNDKIIKSLTSLSNKNKDLFSYIANHPGVYTEVRKQIPFDYVSKFDDCVKCARGADNFSKKTISYLRNPSLLEKDMDDALKDIRNSWYDEEINKTFIEVEFGMTSPAAAVYKINESNEYNDELKQRFAERVNEQKNEDIKNAQKRYRKTKDFINEFKDTYKALEKNNEETLEDEYLDAFGLEVVKNGMLSDMTYEDMSDALLSTLPETAKKDAKQALEFMKEKAASSVNNKNTSSSKVEDIFGKSAEPITKEEQKKEDEKHGTASVESIPAEQTSLDKLDAMAKASFEESGFTTQEDLDIIVNAKAEAAVAADDALLVMEAQDVSQVKTNELNVDSEAMLTPEDGAVEDKESLQITNRDGYANSLYDIRKLQKIHKPVENTNPEVKALKGLGAFSFIDDGSMHDLMEANAEEGKGTKVHFIIYTKDNLPSTGGEDSGMVNPFKYNKELNGKTYTFYDILEAVEVEEGGIQITDGGPHYQIIGTLGGYKYQNDKGAWEENESLKKQRDEVKIELSRRIKSGEITEESGWVLMNDSYNYVRKIYGGRFVKSVKGEGYEIHGIGDVLFKNKPLKTFENPSRYVGLQVVMEEGTLHFPKREGSDIQILNSENARNLKGSVWMLTQQADGRWYPRYCSPASAHKWRSGINNENAVYKTIHSLITDVCNYQKDAKRAAVAKYELCKYLYMGKKQIRDDSGVTFSNELHYDKGKVTSNAFMGKEVVLTGNAEEDANRVEELLFSEESPIRMQFSVKRLKKEGNSYIDYVIKNSLLETDLAQVENLNASIDLFKECATKDGREIMTDEEVISVNEDLYSATMTKGKHNPPKMLNIKNGDQRLIKADGIWKNSNGETTDYPQEMLDKIYNNELQKDVTDVANGMSYYHYEDKISDTVSKFYTIKKTHDNNTYINDNATKAQYDERIKNINNSNINHNKIQKAPSKAEDVFPNAVKKSTEQPIQKQQEKKEEKPKPEPESKKPITAPVDSKDSEVKSKFDKYYGSSDNKSQNHTSKQKKQFFEDLKSSDKEFAKIHPDMWDMLKRKIGSNFINANKDILPENATLFDIRTILINQVNNGVVTKDAIVNEFTKSNFDSQALARILTKCKS